MARSRLAAAPALFLLLLLLAPARPASGQDYDPADENQDGTISNHERRKYRRLHKNTGGPGDSGGATGSDSAPVESASGAPSSGSGQAAMGKAMAAASAMKGSMVNPDSVGSIPGGKAGGGAGGPPNGAQKAAGESAAAKGPTISPTQGITANSAPGSTGNVSNPQSGADFALAARSGYAPAFAAAGLKMSSDGKTVLRLDGSPASADDLARLRRQIEQMPQALTRRPDFFSVVTPERFSDLKTGYHAHPELGGSVYKDVGTTAQDRDFVRTNSCEKASGDCNENSEKASYKKGEFVPPEDLDKMWADLQKKLDEEDAGEKPGEGRAAGASGEAALETLGAPEQAPLPIRSRRETAAQAATAAAPQAAPAPAAAQAAFTGAKHWAAAAVGSVPFLKNTPVSRNPLLSLLLAGGAVAVLAALLAGRESGTGTQD